jgi:GT2 family glycosyltransferase
MSGAWERESPSVLLAILTREIVTTKWAASFRNLALPGTSGITFRSGAPFDVARNSACEDALRLGFQWVMFLDDDVIAPPDTFARLVRHERDVVSGLYYRRHEPICPVAMALDDKGQPQWVTSWSPPDSLLEVDFVGAGCLLIHRRVLERMARPWFEWEIGKKDPVQGRTALSEDFSFCRRAKEVGFKIHLDTSIHCEHVGLGQSGDGNFKPSSLP